eukprot:TRINITY_DN1017_c0_g2_i2.p1 TRINITY_DN1017_c0_g2~~TRINITY_DN1017_c0_g2_i2.p1  ORF type:complete len:358 (-),score=33.30 TRINITY_DN1017_c0_g2_i2:218-1258(-)
MCIVDINLKFCHCWILPLSAVELPASSLNTYAFNIGKMATGLKDFLQDLVAGTFAGSAQVCVGHPFDTIKVKLQTQGQSGQTYTGVWDATQRTFKTEGIRGMYRGILPPLGSVALFNAVLFSSRGVTETVLKHSDGSPLNIYDRIIAGFGAGFAVSFVATPTELLKCRLQSQGSVEAAKARLAKSGMDSTKAVIYRGPLDVARYIIKHEGGILGLFKGLNATLLREMPGNALYFGGYEGSKMYFAHIRGLNSVNELDPLSLMIAGGIGGVAFWGVVYPTDVWKSRIQVDDYHKPKYSGIIDCAQKVLKEEGIKGWYKGYMPCLMRSFPANAITFVVYELVIRQLTY